jgi:hypothetical protein
MPILALLFVSAGNTFGQQIDSTAWYRITAKHSGKCLSVEGGASFVDNGVGVIQWDCIEPEETQKWQILPVGFGYYKIVARHSGKALETRGGVGALRNQVAVQQWDYVGAANQKWWLNPLGDGFYQIVAAHSLKSLDVNAGPGVTGNGAPVQQWDYLGGDNQKWKLTPVSARRTAMTRFNPATNGFQFANTFKNDLGGGARSDGLCGGMMYAAMDYFVAGGRIPRIDYRPAIGTTLQTYLYNRQTTQILSNLDRFEDMIVGSGPRADKRIYFERGIKEETLRELRRQIDAGTPVVLALQNADDALGHSVLAIGYDMGRYRGDLGEHKEELSIYVYDPNHPGETRILTPDAATQRYVYREASGQRSDPNAHWLTYFVDTRYRGIAAPTIPEPNLGGSDGLVRELRLTIRTGGDELVGGNDEVQFTVHIDGRPPQIFENLNHRMRWISFYEQTISLLLDSPVRAANIRSFDLTKTSRLAANGADIWDLDAVTLDAYGGFAPHKLLFHDEGQPLTRFTENFRGFSANIPVSPDSLITVAPPVGQSNSAGSPAEVAECKNTLRSGRISWGAGTSWAPGNIDRLCNLTRNARNTISCFQSNVEALGWAAAIDRCR